MYFSAGLTLPFIGFDSQEQKIRISNIKIRSLEKRSFTVTLDRDTRRAFKDVQRCGTLPSHFSLYHP